MADRKIIESGRIQPGMTFNEQVWTLTSRIKRGKVTTYGEIARRLGTRAYRAVGAAMHNNPYAPTVPCHRVIGSDGRLTGFATGLNRKQQMLTEEGVTIRNGRVDLAQHFQTL